MTARALAIALALGALAPVASGALHVFEGYATGLQQRPPAQSPANADIRGVYDDVANVFSFTWEARDLIGEPAVPGLHIHNAGIWEIGPQVFVMSTGAWPLSGSDEWHDLSVHHVNELFAGRMYVNFHTSAFPGGEMRGQFYLVPAPGVTALAFAAACSLALRPRRAR